jgi:hypothetical protein
MKQRIGVLDFETDPFARGAECKPFCWGVLFDDGTFYSDWSDDCVTSLAALLRGAGDCTVYAHNGGRFDFLFLSGFLDQDALILDGRIMRCAIGKCELRDSFLILPHALGEIGLKLSINHDWLTKPKRGRYKRKILNYLKQDCVTLLAEVERFRANFGDSLTLAGAARRALQKSHKKIHGRRIEALTLEHDRMFRRYYFGGRTENFEKGVLYDDWKMYDMRSCFPAVMRDHPHPTGSDFITVSDLTDSTDFITFDGYSDGLLPVRKKGGGVEFPRGRGIFHATGHEVRYGIAVGAISINRIEVAYEFVRRENFAPFINAMGSRRMACIESGDVTGAQQFKNVMNSSYGGQGLAIDSLGNWQIHQSAEKMSGAEIDRLKEAGFFLAYTCDEASFWQQPLDEYDKARLVKNVAMAASVTGAARTRLAGALAVSDRPAYCDTDGIICRSLDLPLSDEIGGWRIIDQGNRLAIAGKKMYALFDDFGERRKASKGGDLTAEEIERIARGAVVQYRAKRPTYSVSNRGSYADRTFRAT